MYVLRMQCYLQPGMNKMIVKNTVIYNHEFVAVGRRIDVISASTMAEWHITMPSLKG